MDGTLARVIMIGMSLFVAALVITAASRSIRMGQGILSEYELREEERSRLEEYAEFAMYDCNEVSGAEVISAIYRYGGLDYSRKNYEIWVEGYTDSDMITTAETETLNSFGLTPPYNTVTYIDENGLTVILNATLIFRIPETGLEALEAQIDTTSYYMAYLTYTPNNNIKALVFRQVT